MDMVSVKSSNIAAVGYESERRMLRVQFSNGGAYDYRDVPPDVYEELKDASSVGSYFAKCVKGKYESAKTESISASVRPEVPTGWRQLLDEELFVLERAVLAAAVVCYGAEAMADDFVKLADAVEKYTKHPKYGQANKVVPRSLSKA
jgi:hypothetical protein